MLDQLTAMNEALVLTGNAPVTLNDGSDEWIAVSTSWDAFVRELAASSKWPFAKSSEALVLTAGAASEQYDYAHAFSDAVISVLSVYVDGYLTTQYEVIGREVYLDSDSGVTIECIVMPEDEAWHPLAMKVLRLHLMAGCMRSLNEDMDEARRLEGDAEFALSQARSIIAAQNPGKPLHRGAATQARLARRG